MATIPILRGNPGVPALTPLLPLPDVPLGGFLVVGVSEQVTAPQIAEAIRKVCQMAPWAPVVLVGTGIPAIGHALRSAGPAHFFSQPALLPGSSIGAVTTHQALAAIRTRPQASRELLAGWFAHRCQMPSLAPLLAKAMAPHPSSDSAAADRRLRRSLASFGTLTRHEWRRVADLALLDRPAATVDAMAAALGTRLQDYRRWVKRLLGVPRAQYEALPGWEPVLELALRRAIPRVARLHPGV